MKILFYGDHSIIHHYIPNKFEKFQITCKHKTSFRTTSSIEQLLDNPKTKLQDEQN